MCSCLAHHAGGHLLGGGHWACVAVPRPVCDPRPPPVVAVPLPLHGAHQGERRVEVWPLSGAWASSPLPGELMIVAVSHHSHPVARTLFSLGENLRTIGRYGYMQGSTARHAVHLRILGMPPSIHFHLHLCRNDTSIPTIVSKLHFPISMFVPNLHSHLPWFSVQTPLPIYCISTPLQALHSPYILASL